jgi:hypothetical protein
MLAVRLEKPQQRVTPSETNIGTAKPKPVKWSRDIDEDDGEGIDRLVQRGGVVETGRVGKMVRSGRLETVADGEKGWRRTNRDGRAGAENKKTYSWKRMWREM